MGECCNCMGYHEQPLDWLMEEMRRVINEWAEVKKENEDFTKDIDGKIVILEKDFADLKTYVDNYFANLDVQDEVNKKLDQMYQDGTLTEIITNYFYSIFINVKYPPYNLAGLKGDGVTDDSTNLQAIFDYLETNNINARVYFPCGNYLINSLINIKSRHILIEGEERAGSRIINNSVTGLFLIYKDDSTNLNFVRFENLFITAGKNDISNSPAIVFKNASYCEIERVSIYNHVKYIELDKAQGTHIYDLHCNNESSKENVVGIRITNRCVSSRFIRCTFNFILNTGETYAFYCDSWAQDLYIERLETTGCFWVIFMRNNLAQYPGDIIIKNSVIDLLIGGFIRLVNIGSGSTGDNGIIIDTAYITSNATTNTKNLVRLENCRNAIIKGLEFFNIEAATGVTCISCNNSSQLLIDGNIFTDFARDIVILSGSLTNVLNNVLKHSTPTTMSVITCQRITDSIFSNNIINGQMTGAFSVDGASSYILQTNNIIHSTHGTTGSNTFNATESVQDNNIIHRE